jgi:hypothetical protein|tara:strand:- start:2289 stop:2630 length:342 start_codon:yes stop_codon:yes gene_type:complete
MPTRADGEFDPVIGPEGNKSVDYSENPTNTVNLSAFSARSGKAAFNRPTGNGLHLLYGLNHDLNLRYQLPVFAIDERIGIVIEAWHDLHPNREVIATCISDFTGDHRIPPVVE